MSQITSNWLLAEGAVDRVQQLRSWTAADHEFVLQSVRQILVDWCAHWDVEVAQSLAVVEPGFTAGSDDVSGHVSHSYGSWSLRSFRPNEVVESHRAVPISISALLFGEGAPAHHSLSLLSNSALEDAHQDLLQRVTVVFGSANGETAASKLPSGTAWSGSLLVTWMFGSEFHWSLLLSGQTVMDFFGGNGRRRSVPVTPVARYEQVTNLGVALQFKSVTLNVQLEPVELTIGQLNDLRVGDIVPLTHSLAQPAHLSTAEDRSVCDAWLAQVGDQIAVELIPASSQRKS